MPTGGLLPFAWSQVELHSPTPARLRARLAPVGEQAVSIELADGSGRTVATVASLALRASAQIPVFSSASSGDSLYRLAWRAISTLPSDAPPSNAAIAVLGTDDLPVAVLAQTDGEPARYGDLESLAAALDVGAQAPAIVLVDATGAVRPGAAQPDAAQPGAAQPDAAQPDAERPSAVQPGAERNLAAAAGRAAERMLALVQRWLADSRLGNSRLVVLTRGAVAIGPGEDVPDLAGAAVWGLLRAAQSEYPDRFVLVDLGADGCSWEALAQALGTSEPQLAIRDGELLGARLQRAGNREPRGSAAASCGGQLVDGPADVTPSWNGGTVLISGGTGGLGGLLARHLVVEHGARDLLLVSRSGSAAGGAAELAAELSGLGARVEIAACDVGDRAALSALVGAIPPTRPLRAVIHAAGVLDDGVIESLSADRLQRVLAPKLHGAWNLHEATTGIELDAFVSFSSVAGTLGAIGQANYAAANAFVDSLAAYRRARGLPAVSIAWGPWETTGMTARLSSTDLDRMRAGGVRALDPARALELFDAALQSDSALTLAVALDPPALRRRARGGALAPLLHELARVPAGARRGVTATFSERLASLAGPERSPAALELVLAHTAFVLGHASVESVAPDQTFKDMGLDSLAAVELRNRLSAETATPLPATVVFENPTPDALAERLLAEIGTDPGVESSLESELTELERRLEALAGRDSANVTVAVRLRALLANLEGAESAEGDEDVRSASAEEVFALIDRELGSSWDGKSRVLGPGSVPR